MHDNDIAVVGDLFTHMSRFKLKSVTRPAAGSGQPRKI